MVISFYKPRRMEIFTIGHFSTLCGVALVCFSVLFGGSSALAADYANRADVQTFIDEQVVRHKFDREWLQSLFAQAEKKQAILDAIARPAEKTKTWQEYRAIFIEPGRIEQGIDFWQKHSSELKRAEAVYGVEPAIVLAILGVETRYGLHRGRYRVLDSLTTLGFDYPPRGKFFRQQLEEFLLLVREQKFQASDLMGSYAGAMGYGQFIPGSYRHYAVDFDGDGVVDILNNPVDAIGSVANYFKVHGWQPKGVVTVRAKLSEDADASVLNQGLKPVLTVGELADKGYKALEPLPADAKATVMKMDAAQGDEYWLGLHNFYVITRYNHSHLYAMAVYQLSREISGKLN
jgi:membrane-bound lytic murein transglycosylase B